MFIDLNYTKQQYYQKHPNENTNFIQKLYLARNLQWEQSIVPKKKEL